MNTITIPVVGRLCPHCRGYTFWSTIDASYMPMVCPSCKFMIPGNPLPTSPEKPPVPNPNKCMRCGSSCVDAAFFCHDCASDNVQNGVVGSASLPALPYDPVNRPRHYTTHPSGVECIQITEHMNFNLGNAVKYLWRADEKGAPIQDLEKAVWYITREIERRRRIEDSQNQGTLPIADALG
jgi:hypothetical protein